MPSVIVISDDEQDELNTVRRPNLSSPIPPERFLGNPESSPGERRAKTSLKIGPPGHKKRRRPSDSDGDVVEGKDVLKVKKAKREERKAVSIPPVSSTTLWRRRVLIGSSFPHFRIQLTIVINSQKIHAVAAQHRWFYHHKYLFAPLVGTKSHFFANLETEIKGLAPEKRSIVKFEEIERQPKLIEGGQMKDYQVRSLKYVICGVA